MDSSSSDSRSDYEIRQFKFDQLPDYAEISSFKPRGFKTPEGSYKISSWREAYRIFCRYLLKEKPRHLRAFKNLEETFLGRRVMFSNDPFLLNEAYQLRSGFYAEIFLPPKSIIHNISRLIQFCRLSPRQFVVSIPVYVDESELFEPEEVEDEQNEVESQLAEPEQLEEEVSEDETIQESVSTQPSSQIAHFTLDDDIPDLAFSKPVSITINTRRYSVSKWRDIVSETARYVYENDSESFLRYLYKNFGPKGNSRPLFSDKRSNLLQASRIDSNLYVETNFSSVDCVKKALLFIRYANIPQSKVQIEYLPAGAVNSDNPTPAESANINTEPEEELEDVAVVENNTSEQSQTEPASIESKEDNDIPRTDDNKPEEFENDNEFDFSNDEDDFVDIGMKFTDDGLPVLSPAHQKLIDAIEEKFPKGIDIDNEESIRTLELASGIPCNKYTIEDLRMILAYNKANNVFYVPKRLADESTVKSMAAFIDQNVDQYNAVSLSVIREKFQDQFDCECDDEELLEFIEWYVFREMDQVVAIDYSDVDGDGVCLPRSITTDEFCENFYGQIENYLEKTDCPVSMSQLRQLYPSLNETIISYALSDDSFGSGIQEETKDGQLFYSIRSDSQLNDDAADEQEPEPECEMLSFTLDDPIPDLKFTKPTAISFGEQIVSISTWTDVLIQTVSYIVQNEPDAFNSLVKQYGDSGSGLHLFSHTKFEKLTCKQINSDYYLNTNFSSTGTVKTAWSLMQSCQLPLSEVRIEYYSGGSGTQNRSSSSSLQVAADNTSFTKPVNKSMFKTCIVVPTQCHNVFYSNLTRVPEAGTSVPVTIWLNGSSFSAAVQNPDFSVCGAPPQVRLTWNPSSPIAQALKKECPESYRLFQSGARVSSQDVPDSITVSCGSKPDEFMIYVNNSIDNSSAQQQPALPEMSGRTEENTALLCDRIMQFAVEKFPRNVCHETRQLPELRAAFTDEFSTDNELLNFIVRNHIGAISNNWVYFLTDDVQKCLLEIIRQLHQEGQILAYYNLLYNSKQKLFDSISVYKDETAIAGLFTALAAQLGSKAEIPFYPTPQYLSLQEDGTIKDALLNYFESNTTLTYEQLEETFPYIPDTDIQYLLKTDNDFITLANGNYTYFDKIYFDKELCDNLLSKIESTIQKEGYISCNDIDVALALDDNPEMTSRALLDCFCKKILPAKYVRKYNVVSDSSKPIAPQTIISKFCETKDCVTLNELNNLADDLSSKQLTALEIALDKMVRINKDKFISPDLIHFDVEEIDRVLESFVSVNDFIPLQDVTSFSFFPMCGSYSWNLFLLESYCRNFSNKFWFMIRFANSQNTGAIVRKSVKFDDYHTLMANAVNNNEIELSEKAVGDFLVNGHYLAVNNVRTVQSVIEKAQILRENRG